MAAAVRELFVELRFILVSYFILFIVYNTISTTEPNQLITFYLCNTSESYELDEIFL